jgi:hypothetical protein
MNDKNTNKLLTDFPILYREELEYGFQCGDGWFDIIYELSAKIEGVCFEMKERGIAESQVPRSEQVKEKFGSLTFYWYQNPQTPEALIINQWIEEAKELSGNTCTRCSMFKPGIEVVGGFYSPFCKSCMQLRAECVDLHELRTKGFRY